MRASELAGEIERRKKDKKEQKRQKAWSYGSPTFNRGLRYGRQKRKYETNEN
jgi:hypothetical protein